MIAKLIPLVGIILVLVVTGMVLLRRNSTPTAERATAITSEAVSERVMDESSGSQTTVRYIPYSPEALADAEAKGTALLFFHAAWCPFCRAVEADILSHVDQIPNDLTILKVDYDTERELKKSYNVTTQHTFVQVDDGGVEVTKWVGGDTLEELLGNIQ